MNPPTPQALCSLAATGPLHTATWRRWLTSASCSRRVPRSRFVPISSISRSCVTPTPTLQHAAGRFCVKRFRPSSVRRNRSARADLATRASRNPSRAGSAQRRELGSPAVRTRWQTHGVASNNAGASGESRRPVPRHASRVAKRKDHLLRTLERERRDHDLAPRAAYATRPRYKRRV